MSCDTSAQPTSRHSFCDDALANSDATEIAEKIKTKELSALEVIKASIARIKKVNPSLNALVVDSFDEALLDVQRHNQGVFSGVPIVIKDNVNVAGFATQMGTSSIVAPVLDKSEPLAKQIMAQGFTLLGKTSLPEFGFNGTTEYKDGTSTKNPWNTNFSSGGSSGGSAALVAAGAVPIAHGNDGGGSIRIPAAACGLFGLKASRGRLHTLDAAKKLPVNMVNDGVLTRSVRDTANFFAAAEHYYHNKKLPSLGKVTAPHTKRLTIAIMQTSVTGKPNDEHTNQAMADTIELLQSLGHKVIEKKLDIDQQFIDGFLNYYGFVAFALQKSGKFTVHKSFDARMLDNLTNGLADYYKKNFYNTPNAVRMLKVADKLYNEYTQGIDLIISPVTPFVAPELGVLSPAQNYDDLMPKLSHYASFTAIHNVLGTPAMTVPVGFTKDGNHRPIGMQFAAKVGDEKTLLELAFELEQAQPFVHLYNS